MRKLVVAGVVLPALLLASAGHAADLPRRYAPAYAPPLVPIFTWTGAYGGIVGGYGFGDFNGRGNAIAGSPNGGLVGGTLGYNYQLPSNIVIGVEGDVAYAGIGNTQTTAGPVTAKNTLNLQTTVRGRVGYAVNRMLFYATGGYAGGNLHTTIYDVPAGFYAANSNFLSGYAIGAGAEYAIMPNLSGKVEYLYTDLGKGDNFVGTADATRVGISTSNIRVGLNYHF